MNNPWLCVLDHRFPDLTLSNCRHVEGSFDVSAPEPQVIREPGSDPIIRYYAGFDGQTSWLRFTPKTAFREVIGTELRIRFRLRQPFVGQHVSTLCWGGNWGVGVRDRQFAVTMAGVRKTWAAFPNVAGQWLEIGWSWRVNGQSVLSFNRKVVASWLDLGVGSPYDFAVFGLGSGARIIPAIPPGSPGINSLLFFPADISLVQLNLLTRERSERSVDAAFPAGGVDNEEIAQCWEQVAPRFRMLITLFRTMVADAVAAQASVSGGSRAAAQLHEYAVIAAALLARYLDGDDDSLAEFEKALQKFLRQLKTLAGAQLADVERQVRQILAGMDVSAPCKQASSELLKQNKMGVRRLQLLLEIVSRTIRTTLEVDWNG
jgi:hypothetical protein